MANVVPTNGWKNSPSPGDICEGDDIVRIRHVRNSLAHHENCQFSVLEFQRT